MRKMILLALLSVASVAAAQTVDCSTVKLTSLRSLSYKTPGVFPNPPKEELKLLSLDKVDFNACGMKIISDGQGYISVNLGSKANMLKVINSDTMDNSLSVAIVGISGYKYPTLRQDFYSYSVWFDYDTSTGVLKTFDTDSARVAVSTLRDASVGYKVDNGPMTPFYYDGKIIPAKLPTNITILDIYALRSSYQDGFDRVRFNIPAGSYEMWKTYPFPR